MYILDIHTHHSAPQPAGVISLRVREETESLILAAGQAYSVGIHPWDTASDDIESHIDLLDRLAGAPEVVAIGECGIDLNIGGPLYRQLTLLRHQVELSERLSKPLVLHNVKGSDILLGAHRDLKPSQPWAIHGFRQKPEAAEMMIRAGFYLSFGEAFNPLTVAAVPEERILAETDESELPIEEIIARISAARDKDMTTVIAANTAAFLGR